MTHCAVCGSFEVVDTVTRDRLPAMQNYVYRTRESAVAAPYGEFTLTVCRTCGFAWNRTFDPNLLVYDAEYDNVVPSAVMRRYYRSIATHLVDTYDLEGSLVVDVGCGNGTFLKMLCDLVPSCRGLGIDPALDRDRTELGGRLVLVKDVFTPDAVQEPPALVLSRHVLEHIARPVEFLRTVGDAIGRFGSCPCYFEVPALEWIVENEAFWDFCYEHCNYFTAGSLSETLRRAGFEPTTTRTAFGAQYRWMEAIAAGQPKQPSVPQAGDSPAGRLGAYVSREEEVMASSRRKLRRWKARGSAVAVWGMATKGVLFCSLIGDDASLIDFCIDVNPNKQGCFVPLTGHAISAPTALRGVGAGDLLVIVMNENYRDEIADACREMGIRAILSGPLLSPPPQETSARREAS